MRRSTYFVFAAVLALVAGACGGSGDDPSTKAAKRTTTTESDSTTTGADGSTTTGVAAAGGATTTAKKGATPAPTAGNVGPAPTTAPDPNAVPAPAKTGTYGYAQTGSGPDGPVPSHGTLVISGGSTQTFKRYFDESKPPSDLMFEFSPSGPRLKSAVVRAKGATFTCTFGSPVPLPPWPPDPGRSFSGHATCTGPLGGVTADLTGSITSRNGDLVGITSNLHITNGNNLDITVHDTESWSISLRVPKTSHQTFSGQALGNPIAGDVTSTLTSTP